MLKAYTVSLLFLLSFVVVPVGRSFFEIPKVIVAELLIQSSVFVLFLKKSLDWKKLFLAREKRALLVLLAWIVVATLINTQTSRFFGNGFRLQGAFMFINLSILALIAKKLDVASLPAWIPLASLIGLLASCFYFGTNINGRYFGSLGEPNALAASAVFLFPWIYLKSNKWVKILAAFLVGLILYLSQSRSGTIAFAIEGLFLLSLFSSFGFSLGKRFLIGLTACSLAWSLPFAQDIVTFKMYQGAAPRYRFESRAEVWQVAFQAGLQKPLFGWGFGNSEQSFREVARSTKSDLQYVTVDSSHNIFLDFWVQGGAAGLAIFGFLIYQVIVRLCQQSNPLYMSIFLGLFTVLQFNPSSVVTLVQFWWLAGQELTPEKQSTNLL